MSEILSNLWLGPVHCLFDTEFLRSNRITHVLTALEGEVVTLPLIQLQIQQKTFLLYDLETEPIYDYFEEAVRFMEDAHNRGGNLYVHCYAGVSRSPTFVAAYLMKSRGLRAEEALEFIRERRAIIDPNDGFRDALDRWERKLMTSAAVTATP